MVDWSQQSAGGPLRGSTADRCDDPDLLGDCSEGVPPVPIPNTEVKPFSPDGTARASVWESRTSPELKQKAPTSVGAFFVDGGWSMVDGGWRSASEFDRCRA